MGTLPLRLFLILAPALALGACAGPREPRVIDPVANARLTVGGFREASPHVAERLDGAFAWAVFPDVEDTREACVHRGTLFQSGVAPRPIALRCAARPTAPAGAAYHLLVIFGGAADLEELNDGPVDLALDLYLSPHDDHGAPATSATRLVVTSDLGGLLFDAWVPEHLLELEGEE